MVTSEKVWRLLPHDPAAIHRLSTALRCSPTVAQLLLNREVEDPEKAKRFLTASLGGLHPPTALPGVPSAVERILRAVKDKRRICIYGDYDVDGTTGTAILLHTLKAIGASSVEFFVPQRTKEGYGLNAAALKQIREHGATLVISVDCGITAVDEALEAERLGLELIVTDHHEPGPQLPAAPVIVHPRLEPGKYPFGDLSGSGVALKLAWALCQRVAGAERVPPNLRELLMDCVALAALGTVADVVPLHDENRMIVRFGLQRLQETTSVGLKALLEVSQLNDKSKLRAGDIGYRLGPRLNALGRMGSAWQVVELLTTTSQQRAVDLARHLNDANEKRQKEERRILAQARKQAEDSFADDAALVLASSDWHPGIIGIVAGRLVEEFGKPTLVIALRQEDENSEVVGTGSGRSVPDFPLHEALRECGEHLLRHGGHHAAAGFKIRSERVDAFREAFSAVAARYFPDGVPVHALLLDAELPLNALTVGLVQELDKLEPYGNNNRRPVFLAGNLVVNGEPKKCGQGERHLRFRVKQGGTSMWCIAFGMGDRLDELMSEGGHCSLAFTPQINEWNGLKSVQLEIRDLQAGEQTRLG